MQLYPTGRAHDALASIIVTPTFDEANSDAAHTGQRAKSFGVRRIDETVDDYIMVTSMESFADPLIQFKHFTKRQTINNGIEKQKEKISNDYPYFSYSIFEFILPPPLQRTANSSSLKQPPVSGEEIEA
uniref:Uncharacterized protein n=1 Tax=Romanomermis culicivorax TaxID=13658 RepID=A0A915ITQ7_ROMCU